MLGGHRCPHPWLPHYRWRRQIVLLRRWGGLGLRWEDCSSPAFSGERILVVAAVQAVGRGGGAAAGNGFGVTAFGAGGVLAAVSCASMMKCAIGARWVFVGASGMGVSEGVAVEALGVVICFRPFLDLQPL